MLEPSQEFRDLVDEITNPTPAPGPVLRAASLLPDPDANPGCHELEHAAKAAGIDIVVTHTQGGPLPDFEQVPVYDVVLVALPDELRERPASVDFLLRYIRGRRPLAFVVLGQRTDSLSLVADATEPHGYVVGNAGQDAPNACVGIRKGVPTAWMPIGSEELGEPSADLNPVAVGTWAVVERVRRAVRMAQLDIR